MSPKLTTRYLGLELRNPLIVGASPFCDNLTTCVELEEAGAAAIFPPGTVITEAAAELIHSLNRRLGYEPSERRND